MSAQAVLSMIASAVPVIPQGSSAADASGFQGLLDTLLAADGAAAETPVAPVAPIVRADGEEAAGSGLLGFLIAPTMAAPVIQPAAPVTEADASLGSSPPSSSADVAPPPVAVAETGAAPEGPKAVPAKPADEEAASPLLSDKTTKDATPQVLPAAPSEAKPVISAPVAKAAIEGGQPLVLPPAPPDGAQPVTPAPVAKAVGAEPEPLVLPPAPSDAAAVSPLPVAKPEAKGGEPQVLPAEAKGATSFRPSATDAALTLAAATVAADRALAEPGESASAALSPAPEASVPTPSTPVPPAPPAPIAAPAPMRALAERTSKPLDPTAPTTGEASTGGDPRTATPAAGATSAAPAPAATPDASAKPIDAAAGPIAEAGGDSSEPAPEPLPSGEVATTQAQAAATRDYSLSNLSRAGIEATAQIAAQILRKLEGRSTRFEMALLPEELGRVDVKLEIDSDGRLAARLAFDNPLAATDLRGRADELRRQLEDAGFHMAEDAFEFAERDSGSNAFDRGQDARHDQSRAFAKASRLNDEIDVAQPPRWLALTLSPSGVDMKV